MAEQVQGTNSAAESGGQTVSSLSSLEDLGATNAQGVSKKGRRRTTQSDAISCNEDSGSERVRFHVSFIDADQDVANRISTRSKKIKESDSTQSDTSKCFRYIFHLFISFQVESSFSFFSPFLGWMTNVHNNDS